MNKKEFERQLRTISQFAAEFAESNKAEAVNIINGRTLPDPLTYGIVCMSIMERNLADVGKERMTTYMSDLSIAEWYGFGAVVDTIEKAIKQQANDVEYMAELVLCVNWKSWEHFSRGNNTWSKFYSVLYEMTYDLVLSYYKKDKEAMHYLFDYLD